MKIFPFFCYVIKIELSLGKHKRENKFNVTNSLLPREGVLPHEIAQDIGSLGKHAPFVISLPRWGDVLGLYRTTNLIVLWFPVLLPEGRSPQVCTNSVFGCHRPVNNSEGQESFINQETAVTSRQAIPT